MICKKRMKRRIAQFMGLAMGLAMGLMFSMNAMAASVRENATLAGADLFAKSAVFDTWGDGSTTFMNNTPEATVKINGTYIYVHPLTGKTGSYSSGWREGQSDVYIYYKAPDGCRSVSMQCDHEADYKGQHWSCSTVAIY